MITGGDGDSDVARIKFDLLKYEIELKERIRR